MSIRFFARRSTRNRTLRSRPVPASSARSDHTRDGKSEEHSTELPLFLKKPTAKNQGEPGVDSRAQPPGANTDVQAARRGFSESSRPLPYGEEIQKSFGHHGIANTPAFIGGAAAESCEELEAHAYSSDGSVAFKKSPDLHTAAHEAAHVVQQRAGVSPSREGTREYEDHANAVADAVASGASAEPLLDRFKPSTSNPSETVQRQPSPADNRAETYRPADGDSSRRQAQPGPSPAGAGPGQAGSCQLSGGTLYWTLAPRVGYVNARIEFVPNAETAAAGRTIAFLQTVAEQTVVSSWLGFSQDVTASRPRVDAFSRETDPFYGAQWDPDAEEWTGEPNSTQHRPPGSSGPREGSRPFSAQNGSAVLNDSPFLDYNQIKEFETAIVVVETGEVLGNLRWNIQRWSALGLFGPDSSTTIRRVQCSEGASAEFQGIVDQYNADRYTMVKGFAIDSADLPPSHVQNLASVVRQLKDNPSWTAEILGAATEDEVDPQWIAQDRADAVRQYLVSEGVEDSQLTVGSLGSNWAIAPTTRSDAETANRRVQITIKQNR